MTPTDELNIFMAGENRRYLLATPLRDAAPDLLEALEYFMEQVDITGHDGGWTLLQQQYVNKARTAIAKARGV